MTTVEMLKTSLLPHLTVCPQESSANVKFEKREVFLKGDRNICLLCACSLGNLEMIQRLLDLGADVNAKHKDTGSTALITASQCGHDSVVEMLCKIKGVLIDVRDCRHKSALCYAIMVGSSHMVKCLCEESANVYDDVLPHTSVLELAITCGGDPNIVSILVENGAPSKKNVKTKRTPLELAHVYNQENLFDILKLSKKKSSDKQGVLRKKKMSEQPHVPSQKTQENLTRECDGYDVPLFDSPESVYGYSQVRNALGGNHSKDSFSGAQMDQRVIGTGEDTPDGKADGRPPSPSASSEIRGEDDLRPTSCSHHEEIKERGQESEAGIYENVNKTGDGAIKGDNKISDIGDYANFNIGPQNTEQKKKVPSPAPPNQTVKLHSPSVTPIDMDPSKKPVNGPGGAMGSVPGTTKQRSRRERSEECRKPEECHKPQESIVGESSSEENVRRREKPGRKGDKSVMKNMLKGTIINATNVNIYCNVSIEEAGAVATGNSNIYMNVHESDSPDSSPGSRDVSPTSSASSD